MGIVTLDDPPFDPQTLADFDRAWNFLRPRVFGCFVRGTSGPQWAIDVLEFFVPIVMHIRISWNIPDELAGLCGRHVNMPTRSVVIRDHHLTFRASTLAGTTDL